MLLKGSEGSSWEHPEWKNTFLKLWLIWEQKHGTLQEFGFLNTKMPSLYKSHNGFCDRWFHGGQMWSLYLYLAIRLCVVRLRTRFRLATLRMGHLLISCSCKRRSKQFVKKVRLKCNNLSDLYYLLSSVLKCFTFFTHKNYIHISSLVKE